MSSAQMSMASSKVICRYAEDYDLDDETCMVTPCRFYNAWVERKWCHYQCPFFVGLEDVATGAIYPWQKIPEIKRRRALEKAKIEKMGRKKPLPKFVPFMGV